MISVKIYGNLPASYLKSILRALISWILSQSWISAIVSDFDHLITNVTETH